MGLAFPNRAPPPSLSLSIPPTAQTMKLFASFVALTAALACADIIVHDNFLDEAAAAAIEAQLPAHGSSRFRDHVELPSSLYQRLLAVMQPVGAPVAHNTRAPVRGEHGQVRAHKDRHADGMEAEGQAALLYLEGDGRMLFRHDATGVETAVDVKPGRFITWPNQEYTHTLEPGAAARRMVGPMAFKDQVMQSIGVPFILSTFIGQVRVKSLVVKTGKKGGVVKLILDFLVTEWPPARPIDDGQRRLDGNAQPPTDLVLSCRTTAPDVDFKSGSIWPNTWSRTWTKSGNKTKPVFEKIDDATAQVTLLEDAVVENKQYKATCTFRVGEEVSSGEEIMLSFAVEGTDWEETVVVTVK